MADEMEDHIPGERAEAATSRRVDSNPLLKRGAVVLAMVAFIGFSLWSMRDREKPDTSQPERVVIRQTADFEPAKEEPKAVAPLPEAQLPTPLAREQVVVTEDPLLDSARRAPLMAYSGKQSPPPRRDDGTVSVDAGANYLPLPGNPATLNGQAENEDQRFNRILTPTHLEGSRAGTLGNRDFIVAMGTSIPCVLETALASD